jgi:hypothetical protein
MLTAVVAVSLSALAQDAAAAPAPVFPKGFAVWNRGTNDVPLAEDVKRPFIVLLVIMASEYDSGQGLGWAQAELKCAAAVKKGLS